MEWRLGDYPQIAKKRASSENQGGQATCPQPSHTCFPRLTIHSSIPTQVPSYPVLMTFASDSVFKAAQKTVSRFPTPDTRLHIMIRARRGEGVTPDVKRCTSIAVVEGICCKM